MKTALDSATLTGMLDRPAKADRIERRANPDHRRAVPVCLAAQVQATAGQTPNRIEDENQAFFSALPPEDGLILCSLLKKPG